MSNFDEIFGESVYSYSRKQSLEDGAQIDISNIAKEAGIRFPVYMTKSVFEKYVKVPMNVFGKDEQRRLWDIVWMLRQAVMLNSVRSSIIHFMLAVRNDNRKPKLVDLKAIVGPNDIDDLSPSIVICLPDED